MKKCPNCRSEISDDAAFCPVCGTAINAFHSFPEPYPPQPENSVPPVYVRSIEKINPYDHSSEFNERDIAAHKLYSMSCYILGFIGIIIALLGAPNSDYLQFHIHQSLKFIILEALVAFLALILCWSVIVPVLALIVLAALLVLKYICFVNVCRGKAVEAPVLRNISFLK